MLKAYCPLCKKAQPVLVERIRKDKLNKVPWGDLVCKVCTMIVCTLSHKVEGELVFIPKEKK